MCLRSPRKVRHRSREELLLWADLCGGHRLCQAKAEKLCICGGGGGGEIAARAEAGGALKVREMGAEV